ncbi:hypothetical protein BpHYR1_006866 [Brachionus plicatilis]|uniref:Uncharacterized protein n=1 Tax=Brachionus plicatilis TaxID=10195 RepID=A0A3M7P9E0_BRAPC|nr:hypothetical protein BpHYR1_006866 [Brachionus plicatilis]
MNLKILKSYHILNTKFIFDLGKKEKLKKTKNWKFLRLITSILNSNKHRLYYSTNIQIVWLLSYYDPEKHK